MEIIPDRIDVCDVKSHGCIRLKKDVMISSYQENIEDGDIERRKFTNIYLNIEQARKLQDDLIETIRESERYMSDVLKRHRKGMTASQIARDTMKPIAGIQRIIDEYSK